MPVAHLCKGHWWGTRSLWNVIAWQLCGIIVFSIAAVLESLVSLSRYFSIFLHHCNPDKIWSHQSIELLWYHDGACGHGIEQTGGNGCDVPRSEVSALINPAIWSLSEGLYGDPHACCYCQLSKCNCWCHFSSLGKMCYLLSCL